MRRAFFTILLLIAVVTVGINLALPSSRRPLQSLVTQSLGYELRLGRGFYLFPHFLLLRDVTFHQSGGHAPDHPGLKASWVFLRLSLKGLVLNRAAVPAQIKAVHVEADFEQLKTFFRVHRKWLLDLIAKLPRDRFAFSVRDLTFKVRTRDFTGPILRYDLDFSLHDQKGDLSARIREALGPQELSYPFFPFFRIHTKDITGIYPGFLRCRYHWDDASLSIKELSYEGPAVSAKFWGEGSGGQLNLKGFSLFEDRSSHDHGWKARLDNIFDLFFRRDRDASKQSVGSKIYLFDVNGQLAWEDEALTVKNMSFGLNNLPITLSGRILFSTPPTFQMQGNIYPQLISKPRADHLSKVMIDTEGRWDQQKIHGRCGVKIIFDDDSKGSLNLQQIEAQIDGAVLHMEHQGLWRFGWEKAQVLFQGSAHDHQLESSRLQGILSNPGDRFLFLEWESLLYDGRAKGRTWIDTFSTPFSTLSAVDLQQLEANSLKNLVSYFQKINGRLDGRIILALNPAYRLDGELQMHDGQLHGFDFFAWLAETFRLPSLQEIDFNKARVRLGVSSEAAGIYDIELSSANLNLGGFYQINSNDLVSGKLTLSLDKGLLAESPKFHPIIKIFPEQNTAVGFDFQVSGKQQAMNFQWLDSETKRRIQERIPDFIERRIEKTFDKTDEPELPSTNDSTE